MIDSKRVRHKKFIRNLKYLGVAFVVCLVLAFVPGVIGAAFGIIGGVLIFGILLYAFCFALWEGKSKQMEQAIRDSKE